MGSGINFKRQFLAQLEAQFQQFGSPVQGAGEHMQGNSPPSVFIGRFGYPKVMVGPLIPQQLGDTTFFDAPEQWIPSKRSALDILGMRLSLVRGKQTLDVKDQSRASEQMREIALSSVSPEVEAQFERRPSGSFVNDDALAFGPSAPLKQLRVWSSRWDDKLEKAHGDTDASAKTAVLELYENGASVSSIMRAFSVGAFGVGRNRKFVPTRWSITAVDSTISETLLEEVRSLPMLDEARVYEFSSLSQTYAVILFPGQWQYEWIEAFFPRNSPSGAPAGKLMVFGDGEGFEPKKEYSSVGGCYYSARLAIAELMRREGKQGGALVLREAYSDYIPLGVWNVRENMRSALLQKPVCFNEYHKAVEHAFARLRVPPKEWIKSSKLLQRGPAPIIRQLALTSF